MRVALVLASSKVILKLSGSFSFISSLWSSDGGRYLPSRPYPRRATKPTASIRGFICRDGSGPFTKSRTFTKVTVTPLINGRTEPRFIRRRFRPTLRRDPALAEEERALDGVSPALRAKDGLYAGAIRDRDFSAGGALTNGTTIVFSRQGPAFLEDRSPTLFPTHCKGFYRRLTSIPKAPSWFISRSFGESINPIP